jgi:hypothetical protein
MLVFAGTCTRCEEAFTWDDLTQQLWCLEAKNADAFGECRRGVQVEQHSFDQECDRCAEEDEGVEVDDEFGGVVEASGSTSSSSKRGKEEDDSRTRKKQRT